MTLLDHLGAQGIVFSDSPAEQSYRGARNIEELRAAAAKHLLAHVRTVFKALGVRGARPSLRQRLFGKPVPVVTLGELFINVALLDVVTIRADVSATNWSELAEFLDGVCILAALMHAQGLAVSSTAIDLFGNAVLIGLNEFEEHTERTFDDQLKRVMSSLAIDRSRIDQGLLIRAAIQERSWLDAWALRKHVARCAAAG